MVRCLQWLNPVQIGLRWSESKAQFNQTRLCLFGANRIPLWGANHLLMLTNHQPFVCLFVWAGNNRIHPPSEKLLRFDNINRRWWWWLRLVCWKPLNHNTRGLAPKWNFRAGNWNHFHQITIGNRAGSPNWVDILDGGTNWLAHSVQISAWWINAGWPWLVVVANVTPPTVDGVFGLRLWVCLDILVSQLERFQDFHIATLKPLQKVVVRFTAILMPQNVAKQDQDMAYSTNHKSRGQVANSVKPDEEGSINLCSCLTFK